MHGRGWSDLPSGVIEHIASFLQRSDIPCGLRLVNNQTAALFCGPQHTTVHLSSPVPHAEFTRYWRQPNAVRNLNLAQRTQLLCHVAASGSIANLEAAVDLAGCPLDQQVFAAAAAAGQLEVCRWLKERGVWKPENLRALIAAAGAGHRQLCEWLLQNGCTYEGYASKAAARGGHIELAGWLASYSRTDLLEDDGFEAVAEGCDLATLQRLHKEWSDELQVADEDDESEEGESIVLLGDYRVLAAAAGSPTPDWRAKVEWLQTEQKCHLTVVASAWAAERPDALERLEWLLQRGCPAGGIPIYEALARRGDVAALKFLRLRISSPVPKNDAIAVLAAQDGHLGFLKELYASGYTSHNDEIVISAAGAGHLHVVAWLLEAVEGWFYPDREAMRAAAVSGSIEVLAYLRGRRCPWDSYLWDAAASGASPAAIEWLAAQGCPMKTDGNAYVRAAANHDLLLMRSLRSVGYPWGPPGRVIARVGEARSGDPLPLLRWLLEAGCPPAAPAGPGAAGLRGDLAKGAEVLAWLCDKQGL